MPTRTCLSPQIVAMSDTHSRSGFKDCTIRPAAEKRVWSLNLDRETEQQTCSFMPCESSHSHVTIAVRSTGRCSRDDAIAHLSSLALSLEQPIADKVVSGVY